MKKHRGLGRRSRKKAPVAIRRRRHPKFKTIGKEQDFITGIQLVDDVVLG